MDGINKLKKSQGSCSLNVLICCFFAASALYGFAGDQNHSMIESRAWLDGDSELLDVESEVVRMVQTNPYDLKAFYLLSHTYLRRFAVEPGDLELLRKASECADQAVALDPESEFGYIATAEVLDSMGQTDRAMQILAKFERDESVQKTWRFHLIKAKVLSAQVDSFELAQSSFVQAINSADSDTDIVQPYYVAYLQTRLHGEDLLLELKSLVQKNYNESVFLALGDLSVELEKYDDAIAYYERVLDDNPEHPEALLNSAILGANNSENATEALDKLKKIINTPAIFEKLDDDFRGYVHEVAGAIEFKRGNFKEADKYIVNALVAATDLRIAVQRVRTNLNPKLSARNIRSWISEAALRIKPNAEVYALMGDLILEEGDKRLLAEAERDYRDAILLTPDEASYHTGLGLVYFKQEKLSAALDAFVVAASYDPSDASILYNQSCALARLQRNQEALEILERALEMNPDLIAVAEKDPDLETLQGLKPLEEMFAKIRAGSLQVQEEFAH